MVFQRLWSGELQYIQSFLQIRTTHIGQTSESQAKYTQSKFEIKLFHSNLLAHLATIVHNTFTEHNMKT